MEAGYAVVVAGRNGEHLREAAGKLGPAAQWRRADVGCRTDVENAFADFDCIDVLVNAAGFVRPVSLSTPIGEAEENWDAVVDANLKGSFLAAMIASPRLAAPGGRVISISSPGFIANTGFTGAWPDDRVSEIVAQTPLGRAGTPADIAGTVLWLASEAGSFLTGAIIPVNGGWRIGG
ncbi:SDR family NAD(P)-dependent oxidoreductase [Cupriavidus gilardii]|uniref:SDR family NAD(P)-dependent oxidoreductase n=1 Tax=Cupriavidus gilardii TaxID=82541 RepID=UPI0020C64B0F|nr:SDR family oxidoreductase [Cupriavidus gilardii]